MRIVLRDVDKIFVVGSITVKETLKYPEREKL